MDILDDMGARKLSAITPKTGVMMINSALITGINYTFLYIHIENICFKLQYFSQFFCSLGEQKRFYFVFQIF